MTPSTSTDAQRDRIVVMRTERIMGTEINIQLAAWPEQRGAADTAAEAVLTFLRDMDLRLSRFRPDSELCRLNRHAGTWFPASEMLLAVVTYALRAAESTQGLLILPSSFTSKPLAMIGTSPTSSTNPCRRQRHHRCRRRVKDGARCRWITHNDGFSCRRTAE